MTKWQLDREGGPWDYPTLGFSATDGAIIDGSLSNPVMTTAPDAFWTEYVGGSAETGVTRWGEMVHPPAPAEPTAGSMLIYDATDNRWAPSTATDVFATTEVAAALSATIGTEAMPNWTVGTPVGSVPIAKPSGDGRAGVWEMTHNDATGYLFHLLTGASMSHSAALLGLGVDNDGIGILIPNKALGRGIVGDQRATVTATDAYWMHATQRSPGSSLIRLEMQATDAAPLLELVTGVDGTTTSQLLMLVSDRAGEAGRINASDGKIRWQRDIRLLNKATGEVATYFENSTSTGSGSTTTRKAYRGASQDYFFGATGSAGVYYPYVIDHAGSQLHFRVAPNVTAADPTNPQPSEIGTLTTVVGIRYSSGAPQLGFFAATPSAKATITGSRGGNAALASLLTELAAKGLITDGTSA